MVFIEGILGTTNHEHLKKIYKVNNWIDCEDFVKQCAKKYGKFLKGRKTDYKATAKIFLLDWKKGKIPYYIEPPKDENNNDLENNNLNDKNENKINNIKNIKGINLNNVDDGKDINQKYNISQDINELNRIIEMKEKEDNKKNKDKMDEEE